MRDEPKVRRTSVAGLFYPAAPAELRRLVETYLAEATSTLAAEPVALIAPHAGYLYSGPIAGEAYKHWIRVKDDAGRVVVIGPSHFVPVDGVAASPADFFETPLGRVPVDTDAIQGLLARGFVTLSETAHGREHGIEVHLPFLQLLFQRFTLVPLVVGEASPQTVQKVIDSLLDGRTRVVISSDLSHYLTWEEARALDSQTAEAIEQLRPEKIAEGQACGRIPICGLLSAARERGWRARMLDLRNSEDTAGARDQVVGYGAFAFEPAA